MEKDFYFIELFQIYKELLTEKQKTLFDMHFCLDLSFAEIAETEGTTRQSIFDAIKIVKSKLLEFEKSLKIKEKTDMLYEIAKDCKDENINQKIKEVIEK